MKKPSENIRGLALEIFRDGPDLHRDDLLFTYLLNEKALRYFRRANIGNLSGWQDSNLRPPGPKPGAMTGLRYIPMLANASLRRERDSNPRYPCEYGSLANCWFQPLTHLSERLITERTIMMSFRLLSRKYRDSVQF